MKQLFFRVARAFFLFVSLLGEAVYSLLGFSYLERGFVPGFFLCFATYGLYFVAETVAARIPIFHTLLSGTLLFAFPSVCEILWGIHIDHGPFYAVFFAHCAQTAFVPDFVAENLRYYLFRFVAPTAFMCLPLCIGEPRAVFSSAFICAVFLCVKRPFHN